MWMKNCTNLSPNASLCTNSTGVNFSPMSPKLLLTYPHREEDQGITMASLFLWLMINPLHRLKPNT